MTNYKTQDTDFATMSISSDGKLAFVSYDGGADTSLSSVGVSWERLSDYASGQLGYAVEAEFIEVGEGGEEVYTLVAI